MTDDSQTAAEKRNSVALAATLFRDDTAESDIFGSLDEHANEDQPYPVTRDPVDSVFGSSETSTARSDAEDFFSDVDKTSSSWANYSEVSTGGGPTANFAALTDEPWPNDVTASGTQVQSYSRNDEQWQTSSHAAHAHERGYGSPPSFGSPSHEMTVSQQSQPSNPTASSYQEMNTMPNRPSGAIYGASCAILDIEVLNFHLLQTRAVLTARRLAPFIPQQRLLRVGDLLQVFHSSFLRIFSPIQPLTRIIHMRRQLTPIMLFPIHDATICTPLPLRQPPAMQQRKRTHLPCTRRLHNITPHTHQLMVILICIRRLLHMVAVEKHPCRLRSQLHHPPQ
jgi:hypothetical protein